MNRFKTAEDKEKFVQGVFTNIAPYYDVLNTIISFGQDRYWRREAVKALALTPGAQVLDVACGTCRVTGEVLAQEPTASVNALDLNPQMLDMGIERMGKLGKGDRVHFCVGDAMDLPYKDNAYDCAISAFALRNVPHIPTVLSEMKRVVKPGGMVVTLELAKPQAIGFKQLYQIYFEYVMPALAKLAGGDSSYRWLCDSWRTFMHQRELCELFTEIGLEEAGYKELTGGVVAVHYGRVPKES